MKKQILNLTLGLSLLTFGIQVQGHDHSKMDMKDHQKMSMPSEAPKEFQNQLAAVYEASLALKEAFVGSNDSQVKKAAKPVQEALSQVDMKLLNGQAHVDWMKYLKTLNSSLEGISKVSGIEDQRKYFADFNQALYNSIKTFGIGEEVAYYQYCPMALSNQGAYWLSDSKEIRNPYFGDKMLKCGSVKEEL